MEYTIPRPNERTLKFLAALAKTYGLSEHILNTSAHWSYLLVGTSRTSVCLTSLAKNIGREPATLAVIINTIINHKR